MNKFITLLCILISINCFSQNEDYQLKVKVSGNMPEFEYIIDIHRAPQNTKIYFSEYTGEENYSKTDKARIKELLDKKDRNADDNMELMELRNYSKIFLKECFMFSEEDPIIKLSDSIINSKKAILNEIEQNKNRVVLDAIKVEVNIKNKDGIECSYHIHAPDYEHYKLITQFVEQSSKEFNVFQ